jgi:hypothetical protein
VVFRGLVFGLCLSSVVEPVKNNRSRVVSSSWFRMLTAA